MPSAISLLTRLSFLHVNADARDLRRGTNDVAPASVSLNNPYVKINRTLESKGAVCGPGPPRPSLAAQRTLRRAQVSRSRSLEPDRNRECEGSRAAPASPPPQPALSCPACVPV